MFKMQMMLTHTHARPRAHSGETVNGERTGLANDVLQFVVHAGLLVRRLGNGLEERGGKETDPWIDE